MIRDVLVTKLAGAVATLQAEGVLPQGELPPIELQEPRSAEHGDFACNFALLAAKSAGKPPRELAHALASKLADGGALESVEVAGPGFLNLRLSPSWVASQVAEVLRRGEGYAKSVAENPLRINVEFVSVNPNGPITVGSGRGAAFGDTLCRVLSAAGHTVHREYYVNDGVNSEQMRLFAESVRHYVLDAHGKPSQFPEQGYKGDYVQDVAMRVRGEILETISAYLDEREKVRALDEAKSMDPTWSSENEEILHRARERKKALRQDIDLYQKACVFLDTVEEMAEKLDELFGDFMEQAPIHLIQHVAQSLMLERQRRDLEEFGVRFDTWFSEQSLHDDGTVSRMLEELKASGVAEEEDGALWLRSTRFGDDKDRVLVRADGRPTYIAADVSYHNSKFERPSGCDKLIDVLGPDHHGYIGRLKAVVQALGHREDQLEVLIFQIVRFMRDGKPAPMRKRDGNIYALSDLCHEVGADVVRFFYLMRSHDTHFDFDVDLAKRQSDENPVFYVQYAHARICSVLRRAEEEGVPTTESPALARLIDPKEKALILKIAELPHEVRRCAADYGVHRLTTYATELARTYHHFYDACRVIQPEDVELSQARLALCQAARVALRATFGLIGISAPERMDRPA